MAEATLFPIRAVVEAAIDALVGSVHGSHIGHISAVFY